MLRWWLSLLVLVFGMVLLARADIAPANDAESNRQRLEAWKKDPEHYARLCNHLREFLALPPQRQEALRTLVHDLEQEDPAASARLVRVLERYADWLHDLPEADRQAVLSAPDRDERLRRIRQIRDREWQQHLPKDVQVEIEHLTPEQKTAKLAELHRSAAVFRGRWELAMQFWAPLRNWQNSFGDESRRAELEAFVKDSLLPTLSAQEKTRLNEAKGHWPQFQITLVEMVDKHLKMPGPGTTTMIFKNFEDLPSSVRERYPGLRKNDRVNWAAGMWPEYPKALLDFSRTSKRGLPVPLGPSEPKDFLPAFQTFIDTKLLPALGPVEKERLKKAEHKWPEYPAVLVILSRRHGLPVPGASLPGLKVVWDPFKKKPGMLPEVDKKVLQDFMENGMSQEERAQMPASLDDPVSLEEWKRRYLERHPEELAKSRRRVEKKAPKTNSTGT